MFKIFNDEQLENWLGEDLGTIQIIDSDIAVDEQFGI